MKARLGGCLLLAVALVGCESTPSRSDAGPADAARADGGSTTADGGAGLPDSGPGDPLGLCPTGATLLHYSFTPVVPLPSVASLELLGLPNGVQLLSAGPSSDSDLRLDVCEDGAGQRTLAAVLHTIGAFSVPSFYRIDPSLAAPVEEIIDHGQGNVVQVRLPPAAFVVSGLEAALGGDLDPLAIRLVYDSGLLILGHPGFIAAAQGRVGVSTVEYTSIFVLVGGLGPGDAFAGRTCRFGETPRARSFQMATAAFEVAACTFLGGGETAGYRIYRLAITDPSTELTPAERERFEFTGEAAVEAVLTYRWNHHNGCDSFHLALPHADYAATTSPLAGCGTPVDNAPLRDFNDMDGTVHYRLRYHGGAWVEGAMPDCPHYLLCP